MNRSPLVNPASVVLVDARLSRREREGVARVFASLPEILNRYAGCLVRRFSWTRCFIRRDEIPGDPQVRAEKRLAELVHARTGKHSDTRLARLLSAARIIAGEKAVSWEALKMRRQIRKPRFRKKSAAGAESAPHAS